MDVKQGRWTARIEGDFVVFLIGAKPDWRHPLRTLRDYGGRRGMPYMLKKLSEDPSSGLLGFQTYGPFVNVQYWRSFEALEAFANSPDPHAEVWRTYWRRVGSQARSGIWHETFLVQAGEYEAVYGNMPPYGLGKAGELTPLKGATARQRLKRRAVPEQSAAPVGETVSRDAPAPVDG